MTLLVAGQFKVRTTLNVKEMYHNSAEAKNSTFLGFILNKSNMVHMEKKRS